MHLLQIGKMMQLPGLSSSRSQSRQLHMELAVFDDYTAILARSRAQLETREFASQAEIASEARGAL